MSVFGLIEISFLDLSIILRLAENSLMHQEVGEFVKSQVSKFDSYSRKYRHNLHQVPQIAVSPVEHLTYSTGPRGSRRLRMAASSLLNKHFQSRSVINYQDIMVTPGCASAIDAIAFSICDEGEGILIPQPLYNGFNFDLQNRSNVRVVGVKYQGIEGYTQIDDLFKPGVNWRALRNALAQARQKGIPIRALLISK